MALAKAPLFAGAPSTARADDPGRRFKRIRERLHLTYREVEEASNRIAKRHGNNDEFNLGLSRLSDIENKGTTPTLFRMYSLCAIYRTDFVEALSWYGIDLTEMATDALLVDIERTHPIGIHSTDHGEIQLPLSLDPGIDLSKTTHLSRVIQRWGKLPLMLLNGLDLENHQYAFLGTEDWTMYPILMPGSLLLIDDSRRKVQKSGWTTEYERPIYFLEHREGYMVGWVSLSRQYLTVIPHPASPASAETFDPQEIDIIGQVIGVANRLEAPPHPSREQ